MRIAFHAIRKLGSKAEAFTRVWPCEWRVNLTLSNGPTFGRYRDRHQAIADEEQWLLDNGMGDGN